MKFLFTLNLCLQKTLGWIAGLSLVLMMVLTGLDITSRKVYQPISGVVEIMGYLGALVGALALSYTQANKEHIAVDLLTKSFPLPLQRWSGRLSILLCLSFALTAAFYIARLAITHYRSGERSETLGIVFYPIIGAVALGFAVLGLTLLCDLILTFNPEKSEVQP